MSSKLYEDNDITDAMNVLCMHDPYNGVRCLEVFNLAKQMCKPVDAVPLVRAHWEWNPKGCHWKCTNCGGEEPTCKSPYCKWCGAKMDEVNNETD